MNGNNRVIHANRKLSKGAHLNNFVPVILIAAAGGIAVAIQAQFMGLMNRGLGTMESVFITYGGGGTLIVLILLLRQGGNFENLSAVP